MRSIKETSHPEVARVPRLKHNWNGGGNGTAGRWLAGWLAGGELAGWGADCRPVCWQIAGWEEGTISIRRKMTRVELDVRYGCKKLLA